MATWQLGGLPSMAPQNDNAPRSSVPQPVQYQQQPNVGLMALQGLRGVAEINQQAQISQQLKEYQARLGNRADDEIVLACIASSLRFYGFRSSLTGPWL